MGKGKTRHREYVQAIKHTKEQLKVGMGCQPFLINLALWRDETNIPHINVPNRRPVQAFTQR